MSFSVKSFGKILISGEYFILKGSKGLSIPVKFSQVLEVDETNSNFFEWQSFDDKNQIWYSIKFKLLDLNNKNKYNNSLLFDIVQNIEKLNPGIITKKKGISFKTKMDFNPSWGLGSSSTLIYNLSKWAEVNPFDLYWSVTNGSGYDLASCKFDKPITYQLIDPGTPKYKSVNFLPDFHKSLFFVYLGKKQSSKTEIEYFNKLIFSSKAVSEISDITDKMLEKNSKSSFKKLIIEHENILSKTLNKKTIKKEKFIDFDGEIKSLGAWGGDFILALGNENSKDYFKGKGYKIIFSFDEMLKNT